MRRLIVVPILALAGLASCAMPATRELTPSTPAPAPASVKPPCEGPVVTVDRTDETACDVLPGQRLDVTNVTLDYCDWIGGEWIVLHLDDELGTCEGTDF